MSEVTAAFPRKILTSGERDFLKQGNRLLLDKPNGRIGAAALMDLRRSADEEAGSLAAALDRSRIAGQLCESMYSAAMKAR